MINRKNLGNLNKRMENSASSGSGTSNFSVMDWSKSGKEKDDLKFYKPKEGKCFIDIVPYDIKSKNHPMVRKGDSDIGDADYMLEVWQHTNIGPSKKTVLCLNRMYGKPCPICEAANSLRKAGKEKEAQALYAKQRAFYNVRDLRDNPETVKIFEVSYKLFEKELIAEAKDSDEGFAQFADPSVDGKSVKFRGEEKQSKDFKFLEFKSFDFLDRDEELSDKILEQAVSFDDCLIVPTYDEVLATFNGSDTEDEDDEEKSSKRNRDTDDESKPSKKHDDDDDEPKKGKSFDNMDDVEEPKKKHQDEDDEEKPSHKCPCGHKFGTDNDEYPDDCDTCRMWPKCSEAQKDSE